MEGGYRGGGLVLTDRRRDAEWHLSAGRGSDYCQASVQVRRRAPPSVRMPAPGGNQSAPIRPGLVRTSFDSLTATSPSLRSTFCHIPFMCRRMSTLSDSTVSV